MIHVIDITVLIFMILFTLTSWSLIIEDKPVKGPGWQLWLMAVLVVIGLLVVPMDTKDNTCTKIIVLSYAVSTGVLLLEEWSRRNKQKEIKKIKDSWNNYRRAVLSEYVGTEEEWVRSAQMIDSTEQAELEELENLY